MQVRSENNFDYTTGGMLDELCIRLTRTNRGVRLGTPDEPEIPNANLIFLCMSTSPPESNIFTDNLDGTYTIRLPKLADLADPRLVDDTASTVPFLTAPRDQWRWYTNAVVAGTHDLEVSGRPCFAGDCKGRCSAKGLLQDSDRDSPRSWADHWHRHHFKAEGSKRDASEVQENASLRWDDPPASPDSSGLRCGRQSLAPRHALCLQFVIWCGVALDVFTALPGYPQVLFEQLGGQYTPVNLLPPEFQYTSITGETGLRQDAGKASTFKLTSYDRFFNKQIWTPLLGGDIFEIRMTKPKGAEAARVVRWSFAFPGPRGPG